MPAPSGTVWGSIVGGYGRIGLYIETTTNNATTYAGKVHIWFWSKYSVSDSSNKLYYNLLSTSGSATTDQGSFNVKTTVASGDGWSTSNQIELTSYSFSYTKTTSSPTRYFYAKLANVDRVGGTMYASDTFNIPSLASYTVKYNANGGSNAPSSQTKWYGQALTLSTTKPTRSGYTFQGWSTANDSTAEYAAGASYTGNAALTLYAVWKANTYTVKYNANGGTGAPSNQTKTHGTTLTLSSTKPTRTGYTFKGWAISASATTASYAAGASYTANADITLYAVWDQSYVEPRITGLSTFRVDEQENPNDQGTYAVVTFSWKVDQALKSIVISWRSNDGTETGEYSLPNASSITGTSRSVVVGGSFNTEKSYTITLTIEDNGGSVYRSTSLNSVKYPIDAKAGGNGVAFGKAAELEGVADFGFDAKFNNPVYGKALGMDRLPAIPSNSDLNSYMNPGCYAVHSNAIAQTCSNIPVERAGRLEVWSSTGEGVRVEQWSYLRQRYIPYNESNAVWERDISRSSDNVWRYYDWWRTTLNPEVSEKLYSKAAMTMCLSENKVLKVVNTYTKIPFDTVALSTNNRLTLQSNSIKIGSNIQYVKVSGQVLASPVGSINGLRHIRIQKTSGGATSYIAWATIYVEAAQHTIFPITPIIASVKEDDLLSVIFYTPNADDSISSGTSTNGWQTFLTVEEL